MNSAVMLGWLMGLALLLGGALGLMAASKNVYKSARRSGRLIGISGVVLGAAEMAGSFLKNQSIIYGVLAFTVILMCIGLPLRALLRIRRCTVTLEAEYLRACSGGSTTFFPLFRYSYNGEDYERQTPESLTRKGIGNKYQKGKKYPLCIDPKNPEICISSRKMDGVNYVLILVGVLTAAFCVWRVTGGAM